MIRKFCKKMSRLKIFKTVSKTIIYVIFSKSNNSCKCFTYSENLFNPLEAAYEKDVSAIRNVILYFSCIFVKHDGKGENLFASNIWKNKKKEKKEKNRPTS